MSDPIKSGQLSELPLAASVCKSNIPFIKLGKGEAPGLNYSMPQSSCFAAFSYFPIPLKKDEFKESCFSHDIGDKGGENSQNLEELGTEAYSKAEPSGERLEAPETEGRLGEDEEDDRIGNGGDEQNDTNPIGDGFTAHHEESLFGEDRIVVVPLPEKPEPMLVMVFHLKVCSFLGEYGAGNTLKTLSLLPGEETEIQIKSYRHVESAQKKAMNVLDSFTEESARTFEQIVERERSIDIGNTTEKSSEKELMNSRGKQWQMNFGVSANSALSLDQVGQASNGAQFGGTAGSGSSSSVAQTDGFTVSSVLQSSSRVLERALDRHSENSSAVREISVNTETEYLERWGEEKAMIRRLKNINYSRTLNFVFRQLLQEYVTIQYVDDVSFIYSNGFPDSRIQVGLDGLSGLLEKILKDDGVISRIRSQILAELCNIYDHNGVAHALVEKHSETIGPCCNDGAEPAERVYCRIRRDLRMAYKQWTVPGIILGIKHRILRTDSMISEALLGQGDALDCYNHRLQEAATQKAQLENERLTLENRKLQQAISILDSIQDPKEKAELYKRIFGHCCETAQTQIIP